MQRYIEKVNTLTESFPYIRRFYGKTVVIKYGGHAMSEDALRRSFALDMVLLKYVGINPVIVHGGGPQIGRLLDRVGKKSEFVGGMRVTDEETMSVVEMVLVGDVNKEIVNNINIVGGRAVGLSGKDGGLLLAEKILHRENGRDIDIGLVGTVRRVDPRVIETLDREKFIPVIAPIGTDEHGNALNVNADTAAGAIAAALKAAKLVLMTDVEGVKDAEGHLLPSLRAREAREMIEAGVIRGGMIPKVECALEAVDLGVEKVHVIDGRVRHALLLEIFTDRGVGTEIARAAVLGSR